MQHCVWFLQCWGWNLRLCRNTKQVFYQLSCILSFLTALEFGNMECFHVELFTQGICPQRFQPLRWQWLHFQIKLWKLKQSFWHCRLVLRKYAKCQLKWWHVCSSTQSGRPVKILSSSLLSQMGVNEPEYLI